MSGYDPKRIEARWQAHWERRRTFRAPNPGEEGFRPSRGKFYVLAMFPYPSGAGMHMGHALNYTSTDIVARYRTLRGDNVLHPIGFDAFGLPAEQYAVDHSVHPRITTEQNITAISRQLKRLGLSFDWDRCFATTDPGYYRWTQWVFLRLYHSYFDPVERRARPIDELVRQLENEELYVNYDGELVPPPAEGLEGIEGDPIGARKWHELDRLQRQEALGRHRLAYMDEAPVNWCPALGTVLANEEVTAEGRSERGNHPVHRRPLRQWMLRITDYAERLLADLDLVDWPEPIKQMQRNWIGRSEGALIEFKLAGVKDAVRVFTTRPDTLFGATYMVLAPEHPLVDEVTTAERRDEVSRYQQWAASQSEQQRQAEAGKKTGAFTGGYAVNPATGERIPIWIADYVLMGYGTGAIMAVPAHDQRDFEFARTFDLPIRPVVLPDDDWLAEQVAKNPQIASLDAAQLRDTYERDSVAFDEAFTGEGVGVNSENEAVSLDGLPTPRAKRRIVQWLEESRNGRRQIQYKLRDWLFSRQRYWGEPFPILHAPDGRIIAVDESELPVELPEMERFTPEAGDDPDAPPKPPLSRVPQSWRIVERDGLRCERELNTMPQWAGSCWYYLRFLDPGNERRLVGEEAERYWMEPNGVDLYIGGVEHAVLHLLYARFWHKVLYDLGCVSTPEPFSRLFNQGYVQADAFRDERGVVVDAFEVTDERGRRAFELTPAEKEEARFFHEGRPVRREFGKMGKSLKNSVSPDAVCDAYGADTLRLYLMYMGPLEASKPWNDRDIIGVNRFLKRVWRNFIDEDDALLVGDERPDEELLRLLHRTIRRVTDDMERLSFHTAIAALIEMNNEMTKWITIPRTVAEPFVVMLAPLAPHLAEELWERLGHEAEEWSVANARWPECDERYLRADQVELVVQVMGKVRGHVTVPADADEQAVERAALADERIASHIEGKTVRKVIIVPGKLVNIVAG